MKFRLRDVVNLLICLFNICQFTCPRFFATEQAEDDEIIALEEDEDMEEEIDDEEARQMARDIQIVEGEDQVR